MPRAPSYAPSTTSVAGGVPPTGGCLYPVGRSAAGAPDPALCVFLPPKNKPCGYAAVIFGAHFFDAVSPDLLMA